MSQPHMISILPLEHMNNNQVPLHFNSVNINTSCNETSNENMKY